VRDDTGQPPFGPPANWSPLRAGRRLPAVRVTANRTREVAFFIATIGLPLLFIEVLLCSVGGWRFVVVSLGAGLLGGFAVWLLARRLPSHREVEERRFRDLGWRPPPDESERRSIE
jgi:hypothetical protein